MQTYLLTLFATAAVLVGLAVAFLVASVQIAAGRFSPAVATLALRDRIVWALLIIPTAAMLLLGVAGLIVSLPRPHPTLFWLTIDQTRIAVGVAGLAGIVLSIACFVLLVLRVAVYTNAPALAKRLVATVDAGRAIKGSLKEAGRQSTAQRSYPFLPIFELLNQAVRDGDRSTLARTLSAIREQMPTWLLPLASDDERRAILATIRDTFFADIPELIKRHGVPSLHRIYIPEMTAVARVVYDIQPNLMPVVLEHIEHTLVKVLLDSEDEGGAPGVASLFDLEAHVSSDDQAAAGVHKALGGVGQTIGHLLPASKGYAFDTGGFSYLDESRSETVFSLRSGYYELARRRTKAGESDALLWLEAMGVTARALIHRGVETGKYRAIKEHFVDLMLDMVHAAKDIAYAGNGRAVSMALFALDRFAREDISPSETEIWVTIGLSIVGLGMVAEELSIELWAGGSAVETAMEALRRVPSEHWDAAVLERNLKGIDDKPGDDARWSFTRRAGVRLRTNFGLMFDETTGEPYAKDDPRRR